MQRTFFTRATQAKNIIRSSHLSYTRPISTSTIKMQNQNEYGQGKSHATGDSIVPDKVEELAPESLERKLPESVHPTGDENQSQRVNHAKEGGSIVPDAIAKVLPKKVEDAVPDAIHDTGSYKK